MASPFPQITSPPQAQAEDIVNEALETLEHQAVYGKNHSTTSGLIRGYYGGRWGGFSVADGTVTLTASATNYVVVATATGVLSASATSTNWNDSTNYARVYKLTTSASAVTAEEDHRSGPGGVHGGSGGTGGGSSTNSPWKTVVRAGTTTTLPANTYANGTLGVGATLTGNSNGALSAQDGVTLVAGDRLLVKNEATASHNGFYALTQVGTGGAPYILTRVADADALDELVNATVFVSEGSTLSDTQWTCTTNAPITVGSTSLAFGQINAAGITSVDASGGVQTTSGSAITSTGTVRVAHKINAQAGTSYAIVAGDRWNHITLSNAASIAVTIAQAGTTGFEDGFGAFVENIGVGAATITPTTSAINGASALVLDGGMSAILFSDGTNYRAFVLDPAGVTVNLQTGTTYTVLSGDRGKLVSFSNASAIAVTLPQATNAFGSRWYAWFQNVGAGTVTITPTTSTIDTAASLTVLTGQGVLIASDGTSYYTSRGIGSSGGSLTNWTEANSAASPNGTVTVVSFLATNAASSVDIALIPKGNGSILSAVPNNLSSGGNKRGIGSVDLQITRTANTNVASGVNSGLLSGSSNTASGNEAVVVGGSANIASGADSGIVGGVGNTASGLDAFVGGGRINTASGDYSTIPGGREASTRGLIGMYAYASGEFAAIGDAQFGRYVQRLFTTTATTTAVTADANSASATNTIVMPNNSVYCGTTRVVARNGTTDQAALTIVWAATRGANAASTALLGTPTVTVVGASAGAAAWTAAAVVNTTNGSVEIRATGAAATNIKWVAVTDTTECNA